MDLRGIGFERIKFPSTLSKVPFFTFKVPCFCGGAFFVTCNSQIIGIGPNHYEAKMIFNLLTVGHLRFMIVAR